MTEPIDLDAALARAREQVLAIALSFGAYADRWTEDRCKEETQRFDAALERYERLVRAIGAWEWQRDPKSEETCLARAEAIAREVMG